MSALSTAPLDPSFLRAIVLITNFKPNPTRRALGALLMIGLHQTEFTAADLPGEITNGSKHMAGAATGALLACELVKVMRRIPSPRPEAKGRKLDVLKIVSRSKAKAWLKANSFNYREVEKAQGRLF